MSATKRPLVEGEDYELNAQGLLVFTASYLRSRGYCCGNRCQNCPYSPAEFEAAKAKRRTSQTWLG
jgi:hypothetical protein